MVWWNNKKNNYDVSFNIKDVNSLEKVSLKLTSSDKSIIEPLLEKIRTIVIYSSQYNDNLSSEEDYKRKYRIIKNVLKEKNLLEKLKDINYEISIGL